MARDKGKSRDHRGTKKVYKKGSNPLDLHERYHAEVAPVHPHEKPHTAQG